MKLASALSHRDRVADAMAFDTAEASFVVIRGRDALHWADTALKRSDWDRLWHECPWATAFQSSAFFDVWVRNYRGSWSPLIIVGWRGDGSLLGIMPLAERPGLVVGAGGHQAEYQGWISSEGEALAFLKGALEALARHVPRHEIRLRYLPAGIPVDATRWLERLQGATLTASSTRRVSTDPAHIDGALRKKNNKSKMNRLKRLGQVELRSLGGPVLQAELERIVAMYDFRQGALHDVCPFYDDERKLSFHLDWIRTAPHHFHATGLYLDNRLISAMLLIRGKTDVHLAISALCPDFAAYSPTKFNIYLAARAMREEGIAFLDLTPGDDPWKSRFGDDERTVWDLVVHPTTAAAAAKQLRAAAGRAVRKVLARIGLPVARLKAVAQSVRPRRRHRDQGLQSQYMIDVSERYREYDVRDLASANDLSDLHRVAARLPRSSRANFLKDALQRIEQGDECAVAFDRAGDHYCLGWLQVAPVDAPPGPAVLYGFRMSASADAAIVVHCLDRLLRIPRRGRPNVSLVLLNLVRGQEVVRRAADMLASSAPGGGVLTSDSHVVSIQR